MLSELQGKHDRGLSSVSQKKHAHESKTLVHREQIRSPVQGTDNTSSRNSTLVEEKKNKRNERNKKQKGRQGLNLRCL